ncbi:MAG TPA: carboxypeptidase regulatory-like domain-containing protein, partial [Candidatus Sulfotelmatobacter sp.]|nr:carboxypeptidase regulatory-like domain-containing protein [Candidatus Sulfotelmatobacter sp.]
SEKFNYFHREGDIMNKRIGSRILVGTLALSGLLLTVACNKNTEQSDNKMAEKEATPAPAATPIDPATVATVKGSVKFDGTAPKPSKIDMSQDPACKGSNEAENIVVSGGDLANVFVYVKDGLGNRTFDVPKDAVVLDQSGCKYHPHVLGVMAGQTVQIKNDDQTTHNIHPTPKDNREWNESQPPSSPAIEKNFAREEIMLPVKCNQHPWMKMYVSVVKNPFYAVTDKSGKYEIKGLPPGDYTIAFVHEKLGEQDQKVTVAAKETKTVDQNFKAAE